MIQRPPRSTRTDTLFPYTTLFRSRLIGRSRILPAHDGDLDRRAPVLGSRQSRFAAIRSVQHPDGKLRGQRTASTNRALSAMPTWCASRSPAHGRSGRSAKGEVTKKRRGMLNTTASKAGTSSEERRVGKEGGRKERFRGTP